MKIDLKEENIERGDLVMTTFGYRLIVEDSYNGFALMQVEGDLSGSIASDWYDTIEDLTNDINITKVKKRQKFKNI